MWPGPGGRVSSVTPRQQAASEYFLSPVAGPSHLTAQAPHPKQVACCLWPARKEIQVRVGLSPTRSSISYRRKVENSCRPVVGRVGPVCILQLGGCPTRVCISGTFPKTLAPLDPLRKCRSLRRVDTARTDLTLLSKPAPASWRVPDKPVVWNQAPRAAAQVLASSLGALNIQTCPSVTKHDQGGGRQCYQMIKFKLRTTTEVSSDP